MKTEALSFLCLTLLATGCSDDFDPASLVNDLRVLAVSADKPYALPGSSVKLEALAFDPAGRSLSWGWGQCIEPASSVALDCLRAMSFDSLTIARDQTQHTLTMPQADAPFVGVVVVACPGEIVPGNTEGIPLACMDGTRQLPLSEFELGLKRIYVQEPARNHNPQIAALSWDGVPWPEGETRLDTCAKMKGDACDEFTEHEVTVQAAADAVESSVDSAGITRTEQVVVQLYGTGGEFDDDVRVVDAPTTKFRAKKEDGGKRIKFWFVVRDDRGGVSWISRQIDVP